MPTSSRRLEARAQAYTEACDALLKLSESADSALESEEYEAVAWKLSKEYDRLKTLAEKRRKKEQRTE